MPVTRAPTACRARTNSRWLAGKQGSMSTMSIVIGRDDIRAARELGASFYAQVQQRC
jgi:hypothetical protein